ncbi:MAG: hypothetical protein GF355_08660, partial [Candidatus Eisenbacteria bacterium]|nr:hypothetical protein [Candidatus Eisenbacteria bacterium]
GKADRRPRTVESPRGLRAVENGARPPAAPRKGKLLLALRPMGYMHRGVSITGKVEGLQLLNPENGFYLNPTDAERLGIEEGEMLDVKAGAAAGRGPARIEPELQSGVVYLYAPDARGGFPEAREMEPLFRLKKNPCAVEVSKHAV